MIFLGSSRSVKDFKNVVSMPGFIVFSFSFRIELSETAASKSTIKKHETTNLEFILKLGINTLRRFDYSLFIRSGEA